MASLFYFLAGNMTDTKKEFNESDVEHFLQWVRDNFTEGVEPIQKEKITLSEVLQSIDSEIIM